MPTFEKEAFQYDEILEGFESSGLGVNALTCFVEWILLSRGVSGDRIFTDALKDVDDSGAVARRKNLLFVEDIGTMFAHEEVSGIAVVLGSSFLTGHETFRLEYSNPNPRNSESGRQMLGTRLAQALGALDVPPFPRGIGIHLLVRVQRQSKNKLGCDGFTVVDEDVDLFKSEVRKIFTFRIASGNSSKSTAFPDDEDNDGYCWLLWTRDCIHA